MSRHEEHYLTLKLHKTVIRLRRNPRPSANWGFKWHMVDRRRKGRTCCEMVLRSGAYKWESGKLNKVTKSSACSKCFSAFIFP
jgi:hypothetical protein